MLWAVHIANEVLTAPWEVGGFVFAGTLVGIGAWRFREHEIARVALLTAVFFIASSIHVPVGFSSVHLLLNGLVGVMLGRRAGIAIFVGVLLQALLLGHGGYLAVGVNCVVMTIPALIAWVVFRGMNRISRWTDPISRAGLVMTSTLFWYAAAVIANSYLTMQHGEGTDADNALLALEILLTPACVIPGVILAAFAAYVERRLENAPEFPLGLLIGTLTVLLTVALNCAVLVAGGIDFGRYPPLILAILHLPVAAIEGVVMGFTVGFLAKVKPELLGLAITHRAKKSAGTEPASQTPLADTEPLV